MEYVDFLKSKLKAHQPSGFEPGPLNPALMDFQRDIESWGIRKGRCAYFLDTGLGKTLEQLEFARQVNNHTGKNVLILAPLAVSKQTEREARKFGISVNLCREQAEVKPGVNITNYEMLRHFRPEEFAGIVLDESSILKSYMGKTKMNLVNSFSATPYRLCCTATPAPNDHMEILNHAEFLGVMKSSEALSIWFINDSNNMGTYRLKNHAVGAFWEWVSTWAVCIQKPSDLGYEDGGFQLPPLHEHEHIIDIDLYDPTFSNGTLFRTVETSATAYYKEKRHTAEIRAKKTAELADGTEQAMVWCETDFEADLLKKYIPGAVEVRGSHTIEHKEQSALRFIDGDIRVLISKPSIFGFGLNFQNCHRTIFCGLSYSYEDYYQAIRRFYRFGQKHEVQAHIVIGSTERGILDTIHRKRAQHEEMQRNMFGGIKEIQNANIKGTSYKLNLAEKKIELPRWCKENAS